jgi:hypothetical protein
MAPLFYLAAIRPLAVIGPLAILRKRTCASRASGTTLPIRSGRLAVEAFRGSHGRAPSWVALGSRLRESIGF